MKKRDSIFNMYCTIQFGDRFVTNSHVLIPRKFGDGQDLVEHTTIPKNVRAVLRMMFFYRKEGFIPT